MHLVYQIGTLVTEGVPGKGFVPGLLAVLVIAAVIAVMVRKADIAVAAERAAKNANKKG